MNLKRLRCGDTPHKKLVNDTNVPHEAVDIYIYMYVLVWVKEQQEEVKQEAKCQVKLQQSTRTTYVSYVCSCKPEPSHSRAIKEIFLQNIRLSLFKQT